MRLIYAFNPNSSKLPTFFFLAEKDLEGYKKPRKKVTFFFFLDKEEPLNTSQ